MNIYPAIDLSSGQCVRLYQGSYNQVTVYDDNAVRVAKAFKVQGAKFLHVVDLDGAKEGKLINQSVISEIAAFMNIQIGGGIRTKQHIKEMHDKGITRIIIGSIAITHPEKVKEWLVEFGNERIVVAFDIRIENKIPKLALHGWQTNSDKNLWQILEEYKDSTLRHVLCTDISRDGTLRGPNVALYKECVKRYPAIEFQASGGVSALNDLRVLSSIPISGAIIGKALYEKKFSLEDALNEIEVC